MKLGVPAHKLILGSPTYGRSFIQTEGPLCPYKADPNGTWEAGVYDYKKLPLSGCIELWDEVCKSSYCYDSKKKLFITYDTPTSISHKMDYILRKGLGGAMFWELDGDVGPTSNPASLLGTTFKWLSPYMENSQNCLSYPTSRYASIRNVSSQD